MFSRMDKTIINNINIISLKKMDKPKGRGSGKVDKVFVCVCVIRTLFEAF